jgi:hypothetical protein
VNAADSYASLFEIDFHVIAARPLSRQRRQGHPCSGRALCGMLHKRFNAAASNDFGGERQR